jgi:hypothetical protein
MRFKMKYGRARTAWLSAGTATVLALGLASAAAIPSAASAAAAKPSHLLSPAPPRSGLPAFPFTLGRSGRQHVGSPHVNTAIIGGTDAAQGELGFLAFIAYFGQDTTTVCSGTVVAANVILTAAHCARDESTGAALDPSGFRIVTGSVDWTNASVREVSEVSKVIVDPAYDPTTNDFDAALLVLSTPIAAPTIRLAGSADLALERGGTNAAVAGWGETYAGSDPPAALRWADTVVQPPAYCDQFSAPYAPGFQLCTVDYPFDDAGTCNGDSGGPLLADDSAGRLVEIGITSYGPADCNTYSANYFTAVPLISSWAGSQINAANPAAPSSPSPPAAAAPTPPPAKPPTSSGGSHPQLPRMTSGTARTFTRRTLAGALGTPFKRGHSVRTTCQRASSSRFGCGVTFWYRGNDYYGSVAVFYAYGAGGTKVFWTDKYAIHWVNAICKSAHRRSCAVHTKRGVW